ncbi:E3 ubiquitin-protein ligase MARCH2 [Morus notabilis]|uniref:E3 ubiquitin-protein ligase MARCH2 n=1 Tax=Morus notabilis TaxID=981085 RepID=W9S127_9ROSA|nr:E3 ubiquitin-protein ligase MARCH2 [Morus notabilis]
MGDHFVLLVDRLLTESTLEAAIERENQLRQSTVSASPGHMISSHEIDVNIGSCSSKLVECRICHDEDDDGNMETPCSCRGSLKYAHRKCVQRWCNEKGDIICEICHQQFKPGYSAPPPLFHYGGVPMNFRGNWEITRRGLHNPQFVGMVTSDRDYVDPDSDDDSTLSQRSIICCRLVAIIFMVLLVLRHTLPIIISNAGEYSMTLFMVSLQIITFFFFFEKRKRLLSVVQAFL